MTPGSLVSPDLMVVLILWPQFSEEFEKGTDLQFGSVFVVLFVGNRMKSSKLFILELKLNLAIVFWSHIGTFL